MKYSLNLKYKLMKVSAIRNWAIFAGIALTFLGCLMIWRSLNHSPNITEQKESYRQVYLAPDTYLVNAVLKDSGNQWQIRSEIRYNLPTYSEVMSSQPIIVDLFKPAYARLPWLYTVYYSIMTFLLILVFYHLYRFINGILPGDPFEKRNIQNLAKSGYALTAVSFFYFAGNLSLSLFLDLLFDVHVEPAYIHYDNFLLLFLIGMAGMTIQLLVRLALKGNEIQTEQDLTV